MQRRFLAVTAALLGLWGFGVSACRDQDAGLPGPYRVVAIPERVAADDAEARRNGRELFLESCALCHGDNADGRGVRRSALSTKPVDFTQETWCRKTTPRRVFYAIREGVPGTAMPAWKALGQDQSWDLVAYLLAVCETD